MLIIINIYTIVYNCTFTFGPVSYGADKVVILDRQIKHILEIKKQSPSNLNVMHRRNIVHSNITYRELTYFSYISSRERLASSSCALID